MLVIRMCLRDLALVVVLVLGADAVTLGASQETTHAKGVTPLRNAQQDFDMPRLVADIRTAVAVRMPTVSFARSGAVGPSDLALSWHDGQRRLQLGCTRSGSAEDAIRSLRGLRMIISAGVPDPVADVADEAYHLEAFGSADYFAGGSFVCQVTGPNATTTRTLTEIVVENADKILSGARQ